MMMAAVVAVTMGVEREHLLEEEKRMAGEYASV